MFHGTKFHCVAWAERAFDTRKKSVFEVCGEVLIFISYLSYQLHCSALPDKRCLSHGMLPLSGHDALQFLNDVVMTPNQQKKRKLRHNRQFKE